MDGGRQVSKLTPDDRKQLLERLQHHLTAADLHAKVATGIAKKLRIARRTVYVYHSSHWFPRRLDEYTRAARHNITRFVTHDEYGNLLTK